MSALRGDSRGEGTTKKPISPSAVNLIYLKIWEGDKKKTPPATPQLTLLPIYP